MAATVISLEIFGQSGFVEDLLYPSTYWESAWCSYTLRVFFSGRFLIVNLHGGEIGTSLI